MAKANYDKEEKQQTPPIYNPPEDQKNALSWVYQRMISMRDAPDRIKWAKNWDRSRKQWEAMRDERGADDWQSNHVVPLTTAVVETVLSEVIDQSPRPIIMPRGNEDAPKARVMQHIFTYTWDVSDGDSELYNVLKDAFMLGTGIAQEYYWREPRKITNEKGDEEMVYDYDDCYMETVRLQEFYVDEKARGFTGPHQARDCIRRYVMDYDVFRQYFSGERDPLNAAKYVVPGGTTEDGVDWPGDYKPPQGFDTGKEVEVLWYWSRVPKDCLYIVANGIIIQMGPNPYKHKQLPFARVVDIKVPHSFYGKGEADLLESVNDELNTFRRMTIDRGHLDLDKMFFVSPHLNLADEDLIARPHGAIPTDDVNVAKAVEYGDVPRSVELVLKHLEDDSVIGTGINPRSQALPTAGTATEAAILKESTLKRIRLKVKLFEKEFLTVIGRLRVANILQYYSQPKLTKIVGEGRKQQFEGEMNDLKAKGLIENIEGQDYIKQYRQIRTENVELTTDARGKPKEKPNMGFHFFDLKPEYFMPVASGGYDIKFEAGSTLPVSKTLMRDEAKDLWDRVSQVALAVPQSYDIVKLTDELLIKPFERNPNDLKAEQVQEDNTRQAMLLDMAEMENKQMSQGQPVESTPYASTGHTQVHIEYTGSDEFKALAAGNPQIAKIFTDHIMGEYFAQQQRQGAVPGQEGEMAGATGAGGTAASLVPGSQPSPQPATAGGGNKSLSGTLTGKIQGGGQVLGGQQAS